MGNYQSHPWVESATGWAVGWHPTSWAVDKTITITEDNNRDNNKRGDNNDSNRDDKKDVSNRDNSNK